MSTDNDNLSFCLQQFLEWTRCDYDNACPVRELLNRVGDTWSVLVVLNLGTGKTRFSQLRRNIASISQRMLTQTLRRLERDGLVARTVYPTNPPSVEYELTALGFSLLVPIRALTEWAMVNQIVIEQSRREFDQRQPAHSI